MADEIFVNQELIITATDEQSRDMDTVDFRVDYWSPTNQSGTPTGTIDSGDIATTPGSSIVIITVTTGVLSFPSTNTTDWRFQIIDNVTGVAWSVMCVPVFVLGKNC